MKALYICGYGIYALLHKTRTIWILIELQELSPYFRTWFLWIEIVYVMDLSLKMK